MDRGLQLLMSRQHGLVTRRQAVAAGISEGQVDRLVARKAWVPVRRGVYAETALVAAQTTSVQRRLLADRAACLRIGRPHVRSHDSAAYELGMAVLDPRRPFTHVTRPGIVGSHLRHGVKHHLAPYASDQVVEVGAARVLGPARTGLDIAREHGRLAGLAAVDSARRLGASLEDLWRAEAVMWSWPGVTTVREVIHLSDDGSDSLGETLARDLVTELGFGRPQTQFGLAADGRVAWCDLRLGRHVFEFDGRVKYQRTDEGGYAVGPVTDVLWREKQRQDWICGFRLGLSRIVWDDLWEPRRTAALARLRREYRTTCALFGESVDDLHRFRPRGPRRRPRPGPDAA